MNPPLLNHCRRLNQRIFLHWERLVLSVALALGTAAAPAAPPVVSNVTAAQRPGSEQVEIRYDLADPDSPVLGVTLQISKDSGTTWTVPVAPVTGALGAKVPRGTGLVMVWDAGRAWDNQRSEQMRFRITASDVISTLPPVDFALIPAGMFTMGNQNGQGDDQPFVTERSHRVTLDAFYIAKFELSKGEWDEDRAWAVTHGYEFTFAGTGNAPDHPVHDISWEDAVKWCNAKTEKEGTGLKPCYTFDGKVFRKGIGTAASTGQPPMYVQCDFSSNGYRLPTEAEWEKAARGGQTAWRFPWGNTLNFDRANYASTTGISGAKEFSYDEAPASGPHPLYLGGTAPVTAFVETANAYGLRQMSGNVAEWCWDIYDPMYYSTGPSLNPRGPDVYLVDSQHAEPVRILRGGDMVYRVDRLRTAARTFEKQRAGGTAEAFRMGIRLARSL
ncbi:MAG: SUMF1/EgtB/PvdO family nonheme iron enzyme [Verrucomicrobiota bacterium]